MDALSLAAAAVPIVSADQRFSAALAALLRGDIAALGVEEWRMLAVQGSMRVGLALIVLLVALTAAGWVAELVRASLGRMKVDPTLAKFTAKLARWGVLLLAGLACLGTFGVETTSFAAVLGAAGFAVGLALQGTLSNFAAGAMLLVFRPFRVGDVVNVAGQMGTVDEIELFTTSIDTFDNRRVILPNSAVFGSTIENVTHHRVRRVDVPVGVAYDADIDHTRRTLEAAIASAEGGLADPKPAVVLQGLGSSSVDWTVQLWAPTKDFRDVRQSLIRSVKMRLDEQGISIPFPQMDVHVRDLPAAAADAAIARKRAA